MRILSYSNSTSYFLGGMLKVLIFTCCTPPFWKHVAIAAGQNAEVKLFGKTLLDREIDGLFILTTYT